MKILSSAFAVWRLPIGGRATEICAEASIASLPNNSCGRILRDARFLLDTGAGAGAAGWDGQADWVAGGWRPAGEGTSGRMAQGRKEAAFLSPLLAGFIDPVCAKNAQGGL